MAASSARAALSHKRNGRRRRQDKPAISARLVLDDHIKGDVGILSQDLFADLFPQLGDGTSVERLKFARVPEVDGVTNVAAGDNHTVAIAKQAPVICCA